MCWEQTALVSPPEQSCGAVLQSEGRGRRKPVGMGEGQWLHLLAGSRSSQVLAQLTQLFTAAWPTQVCVREGVWRQHIFFFAAISSLRLLPYSSTLKDCVQSGSLMVYSPAGASAARGKDRSVMPPTGVTFSHCAIRFPLGSCIGSCRELLFPSAERESFSGYPSYHSMV